jgi:peptide/nickel transport system permease protein
MGIKNRTILLNHVIPNAINPVIAIAGIELGSLLGGTLLIEVIFGLPGMGRLTLNAIYAFDYPLIIGCCFIAGVMVIISGFLSDIVRIIIDKRLLKGLLN